MVTIQVRGLSGARLLTGNINMPHNHQPYTNYGTSGYPACLQIPLSFSMAKYTVNKPFITLILTCIATDPYSIIVNKYKMQ